MRSLKSKEISEIRGKSTPYSAWSINNACSNAGLGLGYGLRRLGRAGLVEVIDVRPSSIRPAGN